MKETIQLRGMTWDHTRGYVPMVATAQRFQELNPHVLIQWSKRSLQEFADKPIADIAEDFDFLVIDHPWAGFAAASGILIPLEKHMPDYYLADQEVNSVGQSYPSYSFNGSQWALPIDAACPVAAVRPDLLERAGAEIPKTFDELIALGERRLVCCPSIPLDVYGNFLNLLMAAGETIFPNDEEVAEREAALLALERLKRLADVIPKQFFNLNPIRTMEVMSHSDDFAYAPYTYGYTNYSRPGYADNLITFHDVIGIDADRPGSTMLGGTGLAISAKCNHPDIAVEYAKFVASAKTQRRLFFQSGGQPGHRGAWTAPENNAVCCDFFTNTLPTLDRAFVRPRYAGYLKFQDVAGDPIHEFLKNGGDAAKVLDQLNTLYRQSKGKE